MTRDYSEFILDTLTELLQIDSPSGMTMNCAKYVQKAMTDMGYKAEFTKKGGVLADLGGEDKGDGVLLSGHIDTLGAIIRTIKGNGRLKLFSVGGINPAAYEAENVRAYTRDGRYYTGTFQLCNASTHANGEARTTPRNFDTLEIVLDEDVKTAADVRALGLENGCYVCFEPRLVITEKGFIKSRFLDDKLLVAIMLAFAKFLKEEEILTKRHVYMHFTIFEETGSGAGGIMPSGVNEILSLDMGCVGDGMEGSERKVSICCADNSGPYDYVTTSNLVAAAKKADLQFAVDVYPNYSSDSSVAVRHLDLRHGLIGPGVYASHGYERSHIDGAVNTLKLLEAYLCGTEKRLPPISF